jgi:CIC family chloride channel protein
MHSEEQRQEDDIPDPLPERPLGLLRFSLLAVLIGIVAGLGAVVFRGLIAVFHNLLFLGTFSVHYDANVHTAASPWGTAIILVPVLGALGVAWLVKTFAPEAKGHGVPEVMDAIYYNRGVIRPVVAAIKSVASALSIGSGGSVGREGPIIQIGSSFGSTVGQWLRLPAWQRITAIAAGAGGGIAATFNTPVGGILFAVEIMMHEVSARTLVPVAIATATATYIGRLTFGPHPSFVIPAFETPYFNLTSPWLIGAYVGLGILMGLVSVVFIRSIYGFEDFFEEHVPGGYYVRHMLGMLVVGVVIYLLLVHAGHYYVQGVGYATVQDLLEGRHGVVWFLLLLFALKLLATSLTLGSGASGGVFSPSLFLGATLGGAYGVVLHHLFPGLSISPPAFVVAGMAGVVGGATGAAIAAIVMIFEMTLDYHVIIPMTITVAISYGVRKLLQPESIYTLKLTRRGRLMPESLQADLQPTRLARDVMDTRFAPVSADTGLEALMTMAGEQPAPECFLVRGSEHIAGVLRRQSLPIALSRGDDERRVGEVPSDRFVVVPESTPVIEVLAHMRGQGASVALVTGQGAGGRIDDVRGVVTKERIADEMLRIKELF